MAYTAFYVSSTDPVVNLSVELKGVNASLAREEAMAREFSGYYLASIWRESKLIEVFEKP